MPNFRSLSQMPADGGDLVQAIAVDSFKRRCERAYPDGWGCWGGLPEHIAAFNEGNHAPAAAVLERAARLAPAEPEAKPVQAKAGGWVMHDPAGKRPDVGQAWARFLCGETSTVRAHWSYGPDQGDYTVIAYSTDEQCPPWTGEA